MGLDTYAAISPSEDLASADREAFERADLQLCGGMLSGGCDSFRGKVYAGVVQHVTGVSLYSEWLPPETVRRMAHAFDRCVPELVAAETAGLVNPPSPAEVVELRKFLRVCSDRALGLVGWW